MLCPECHDEIGKAVYCACGWKKYAKSDNYAYPNDPPRVKCAHDACIQDARVKIHTAYGWANLCMAHYVSHYEQEARANFKAMGLERYSDETREQHVERVREYTKLIVKRVPNAL